jgi:hypothetical protein
MRFGTLFFFYKNSIGCAEAEMQLQKDTGRQGAHISISSAPGPSTANTDECPASTDSGIQGSLQSMYVVLHESSA